MNCKHISTFSRRLVYSSSDVVQKLVTDKHVDYDIIVSGGGMIGSTLACVLSRNPLLKNRKILLIEGMKKKKWSFGESYSNRVSAISPSTRKLFESVGVWDHIKAVRLKPVKEMKVWGSGSQAAIHFPGDVETKKSTHKSDVAYIVENDVIIAAVEKELDKLDKVVNIVYGTKVHNYQLPASSTVNQPISIEMEDGKKYTCSLLLGTDGANSKVRQAMDVNYVNWSYGQSAIVGTLSLDKMAKNDVAWQRFLPTGPIALLPLNDSLSSLVWSTSTENAKQLMQVSKDEFVNALNKALVAPPEKNVFIDFTSQVIDAACNTLNPGAPIDNVSLKPPVVKEILEGSRASFPLGFGHSSCYVKPGVALLGDAAHRVHPLAGQGVNLGFGDINTLNRLISEAITNGRVLNSYSTLKRYETERLRSNLPTMLAVDLINKVYSNSNTALTAIGDFAIQFANKAMPVKNMMMKQAS